LSPSWGPVLECFAGIGAYWRAVRNPLLSQAGWGYRFISAEVFTRKGWVILRNAPEEPGGLLAVAIAPEQFAGKPQEKVRVLKQEALLSQQMAYHRAPVQIEDLFENVFSTIW
jgi:hypothetical protein